MGECTLRLKTPGAVCRHLQALCQIPARLLPHMGRWIRCRGGVKIRQPGQ